MKIFPLSKLITFITVYVFATNVMSQEKIASSISEYNLLIKNIEKPLTYIFRLNESANLKINHVIFDAKVSQPKYAFSSLNKKEYGLYNLHVDNVVFRNLTNKDGDFSGEEGTTSLSVSDLKVKAANIILFPNPFSQKVIFKNANTENHNTVKLFDFSGRKKQ